MVGQEDSTSAKGLEEMEEELQPDSLQAGTFRGLTPAAEGLGAGGGEAAGWSVNCDRITVPDTAVLFL